MVICGRKQEVLCQGYTYDPHLNNLLERRLKTKAGALLV